jgi:hypothetical protein
MFLRNLCRAVLSPVITERPIHRDAVHGRGRTAVAMTGGIDGGDRESAGSEIPNQR